MLNCTRHSLCLNYYHSVHLVCFDVIVLNMIIEIMPFSDEFFSPYMHILLCYCFTVSLLYPLLIYSPYSEQISCLCFYVKYIPS